MKYSNEFLIGKFIKRYKRFFVDCEYNGEILTAYNPNTGSMRGLLNKGCKVALSKSDNPTRKLKYTVEAFELDSYWVYTNTVNINNIVKKGIEDGIISEFKRYTYLKPEYKIDDSRIDFYIEKKDEKYLVEVKNVTLLYQNTAYFPDTITKRGSKHLKLLSKFAKNGFKCFILYIVGVDADSFKCADFIDRDYCMAYNEAIENGVNKLLYKHIFDPIKRISNIVPF
ncbi:DNA/RNA nuclease SfsA [Deferribacter thermophilus]|uniref:DNA/RNA nuclease SfsA n=1 Tax=Deferribacter thermophilus TaxID=53573 RepID=UPI003C157102